jgi:hypothetical protein
LIPDWTYFNCPGATLFKKAEIVPTTLKLSTFDEKSVNLNYSLSTKKVMVEWSRILVLGRCHSCVLILAERAPHLHCGS